MSEQYSEIWTTTPHDLRSPYPWFGGKSMIASEVWARLGDVPNFIDPFFGSGSLLLSRPEFTGSRIETVNDLDGMICNFWRALKADPGAVAGYADDLIHECDLHARHSWLVGQKAPLQARLEGDPEYFDAKIAGWWVWGMCLWIGAGFCSGQGPWQSVEIDGVRQLVHLGSAGQGVNRQLVHLGNAGRGVKRQLVHLGDAGQGVNRNRVHLSDAGQGVNRKREALLEYMQGLADRMRNVRVCCGDWSRVCGPSPTYKNGMTAVVLDPPYSHAMRDSNLYNVEDDCSAAVRTWAVENGDNPLMRICLFGYAGEHDMPRDWECLEWKAGGGFGSRGGKDGKGRENAELERCWFSPACLKVDRFVTLSLFDMEVAH